jgi:hypothetical protein
VRSPECAASCSCAPGRRRDAHAVSNDATRRTPRRKTVRASPAAPAPPASSSRPTPAPQGPALRADPAVRAAPGRRGGRWRGAARHPSPIPLRRLAPAPDPGSASHGPSPGAAKRCESGTRTARYAVSCPFRRR